MFGIFQKFKDGLAKTVSAIAGRTRGLFGGRKIDAASLEELEEALYTADFGVETTVEVVAEIKAAYRKDPELKGRKAAEIGAEVLRRVLQGSEGRLEDVPATRPMVIAIIGVNGSGKTTTCAKLGWRLKQEGRSVTLGAADTFRAAAIEQLQSWARRLDLEVIAGQTGGFRGDRLRRMAGCKGPRPGLPHHRHGRPLAYEEQLDGRAGEDPAGAAKKRSDGAAAPLARGGWDPRGQFDRAGPGLSPEFRPDRTDRDQARRHQSRRRLGGDLSSAQDSDLFLGLGEQPEDLQPFSVESYAKAVFGLD